MNITNLITGSTGVVISSFCILIILMLILAMSLRLLFTNRRRAYFSLTVSLCILSLHYSLIIAFELSDNNPFSNYLEQLAELLKVVSFIMINMSIYQLYNSTRLREYLYFFTFLFIAIVCSLVYGYVPLWFDGTVEQIHMLKHSFLDIYLIALLFVAFYFITPVIGQHIKYQVSIAVYFTIQLSTVINTYIIIGENLWLSGLSNFLPILYYFILFMFVFERVVELMQAIYQSSITDGLTGLYNRRYFHKRVSQFISQNRPFSIIFGDIDNFKKLNDTKGHQAGDDVLRQVAQIIMEISEDIGMSGRYGGEEMVLMIFDPNTVKKVAEEIRSRIEKETQVTLSLGYSKYRKGLTADQLIQQADQAMYKSKKSGKNKVTAYSVG